MGFADYFQGGNDTYNEAHNKGSYTHDAIGGLVAYEAAKAYENHVAANGKPDSHAKAKEIAAGFAGAIITQLAETKGKDLWDAHQQTKAREHAEEALGQQLLDEYQ